MYNPGVTDRSGEIFAQYLSQGASGVAATIQKEEEENKNRARAFDAIVNYGDATGLASKSETKPLSLEGAQALIEGRLMKQRMAQQQQQAQLGQMQLQQAQGDQTVLRRLMGGMAPDPGAPTMAGADAAANPSPEMVMRGVPALSPAMADRLAEARYNQLTADATAPNPLSSWAGAQADPLGTETGAIQNPTSGAPLDATTAEALARKAGLPIKDQLMISRENLNAAHAERYLRSATNPTQIDQFDLPYGAKGVSVRGSKDLKVLTDPTAPVQTEEVADAAGNMHTIVRNTKSGAAVFVPGARTAENQKMNVSALVEGEKALRAIDDDIDAWHSQQTNSQDKNRNTKAPDPAKLKDLQTRRDRLQSALDQHAATAEPSAPPAAAAKPATAQQLPPEIQSLYDQANAAIAKGKDPAAVRQLLDTKLKEKGWQSRNQ